MMNSATKPASSTDIEFDVHKAVIEDLIHAQNGTLATAIRELVMNSIDAGATRIGIQLDEAHFEVLDNGKGFESRADIETNFRVFGQPHDRNDAIYGRFRIGRGQIMSFAEVTWTSKSYAMHVDVRKRGYAFKLSEYEEEVESGCRVRGSLYEPIEADQIVAISRSVKNLVAYCEIDVQLNGKRINVEASDEEWDVDNDRYRLRWSKSGDFHIYNQGVFVKTISRYESSLGGTVITKKPLELNMARNEVTERDPLWAEIRKELKKKSDEQAMAATYSKNVSPEIRANLIGSFLQGNLPDGTDILRIPIFLDIRGRSLTLSQVIRSGLPVTECPTSMSGLGDMIANARRAIVLSDSALDEWRQYLWDFEIEWVGDLFGLTTNVLYDYECDWLASRVQSITCITLDEASKGFDLFKNEIPKKNYTERQKVAVQALQSGANKMAKTLSETTGMEVRKRKIGLGVSDTAEAWTDGYSQIWFDKRQLKQLDQAGSKGVVTLATLLLHEYMHEPTDDDCAHSFEFYKLYHDLSSERFNVLGSTANTIETVYINRMRKAGIQVPKTLLSYHRKLSKQKASEPTWDRRQTVFRLFLRDGADGLSKLDEFVLKKILEMKPRKEPYERRVRVVYKMPTEKYGFFPDFYGFALKLDETLPPKDHFRDEYGRLCEGAKEGKADYCVSTFSTKLDKRFGTTKEWWKRLVEVEEVPELMTLLIDSELSNLDIVSYQDEAEGLSAGIGYWLSRKVEHSHRIDGVGSDWFYREDPETKSQQDAVLQSAFDIVKYAFSSLRSEEDRKLLAEALLSDRGRKRIESALERVENSVNSDY